MSAEPSAIPQQREPGFESDSTPRPERRRHAETQLDYLYRQIDATATGASAWRSGTAA